MEAEDHYKILGLPSGTEGAKVHGAEIRKAYKAQALKYHPDKRPDDPNAATRFQKIQTAYELLTDETARKAFDEFIRLREERIHRESHRSSEVSGKRRKMMDDLNRREKAYELQKQQEEKEKAEEERAAKKLREELARIRALHAQKYSNFSFSTSRVSPQPPKKEEELGEGLDKSKMLKVTWDSLDGRGDYSVERLREIFEKFGTVEDIVIRRKNSKKKASAVIVMGSKAEVDAATRSPCGDISNPLLVLPLLPSATNLEYEPEIKQAEADNDTELNNVVGAGYHAFEDNVLKKLQKAAEKARSNKQTQG